ncbi:MAG: alpha/beta fold hydrolase [Dokdonella sp.]
MTIPSDAPEITPPSLWKTLGELKALRGLGKALLARRAAKQRSDGDPVLVVPGLGTNDAATVLLRHHLERAGYDVHTWNQGINRGPRDGVMRKLSQRVRAIARTTQRPVRIVGWSLGGLMARIVAGRVPAAVESVVALGSPLNADPAASHLSLLYSTLGGRDRRDPGVRAMLRDSAKVPVTSIYSRDDGVVAWQASADAQGECHTREVTSTHFGLMVDPEVHEVVAQELARD